MKAKLNAEQEEMKNEIKKLYDEATSYLAGEKSNISSNRMQEIIVEMGSLSHNLHNQLTPEPKHRKYMIKNRGVSPRDPDFYNHIHAVEDLLKYLEDINANDDPDDVTLDTTFFFKVYSRRWGHDDLYELTRNEVGWYVSHMLFEGQSGKNADPVLTYMLRNDNVSYPYNLSNLMEDIWMRAQEEGLDRQEVQKMLDKVSEWLYLVEKNYPEEITR